MPLSLIDEAGVFTHYVNKVTLPYNLTTVDAPPLADSLRRLPICFSASTPPVIDVSFF